MEKIIIYGLGYGLLFGGYTDMMRAGRAGYLPRNAFNVFAELAGGIGTIAFFIWGFFAFQWWVPLLAPIAGGAIAVLIKLKVINLPQLHIAIGTLMCLYSLG